MFATSVRWRSGGRLFTAALLGGMTISSAVVAPAEAMPSPDVSGSHVSLASATISAMVSRARATHFHQHVRNTHHVIRNYRSTFSVATRPSGHDTTGSNPPQSQWSGSGGISQWAIPPGHPAWALADFAGDPYANAYGGCTWWAFYRHRNLPVNQLGMASSWASRASALGLSVGSTPAVGATVVFQPGVQGAGSGGHVGVVEGVLGGGWFLLSEMNFYFNGGGWGRISYRYAHIGAGVSFIY